ncbi:MAG TPA: CocE/NonD family hydrolase [Rhodocyclaceae bacterium]
MKHCTARAGRRPALTLSVSGMASVLLTMCLVSPSFADDFVVERNVMIPMRDGVLLAMDVYRPAVDDSAVAEPLPLVLTRTPYGKDRESTVATAEHFARHGYVAVIQDMRGRYESQGEFSKYSVLEPADGYDTVEWLAKQAYSNGRIGMWGTSYGAHTQADAAKLDPASLRAMLLNQGGMANAWDHAVRHGGAFELGRELTWAFRQIPEESDDPLVRALFEKEEITAWYSALPIRPGLSPLSVAPEYEAYILNEYTRSDYGDFWRRISLNWSEHYEDTADAAMLHVGGWYDIFLRGTIRNYVELSRLKNSPVELMIGPWTHSGNDEAFAGDVDFGRAAAIADFDTDFQRRWFDRSLKNPAAAPPENPVRLFVMGTGDGHRTEEGRLYHGGYWTEAPAWPLPDAETAPFYFHADGSLTREPPNARRSSTTYTFDPSHPVPTLGGNVSARVKDGAFDQRERPDFHGSRPPFLPLRSRSDVLVFQTAPLEDDVVVIGPIEVVLFASSTAVDTDFTAKLVDVYPPGEDFPGGFDMNVSDALVRASYRDDRHTRDLIEPGRVYRLIIRPFATANVFKKGHRIRVDISSSNFPRFDVNPNTGEPLGQHRRTVSADNTIYHERENASHILLPILPAPPRRSGFNE